MSKRKRAPSSQPGQATSVAAALRQIEAVFAAEPPEDGAEANDSAPPAPALDDTARAVEAMLFASTEPLSVEAMADRLPAGADVPAALEELKRLYVGRGVELKRVAGKWRLQTPAELSFLFESVKEQPKKLPKAAMETLAVIAYHQPVTRAEIEEIRGVSLSKGTLDFLLEINFVRPRGRRRSPGRPLTYGTTDAFLAQFGLGGLEDLPGKEDLKAAGVLDARAAKELDIPSPQADLTPDEDPLGPDDEGGGFFVDHTDAKDS
jgi:segregation and condensation protein B